MLKNKNQSQSGQVILFVIVAVTIALSMGVAISTRTIFSSSRVARSDTSSKVFTAAEGGAERFSTLSFKFLKAIAADTTSESCSKAGTDVLYEDRSGFNEHHKGCLVSFDFSGAEAVKTRAFVTVDPVKYNFKNKKIPYEEGYAFYLEPNTVKEINLAGYAGNKLKVCWEQKETVMYGISYNSSGENKKSIVDTTAISDPGKLNSAYVTKDIERAEEATGYGYCKKFALVNDPYGFRLRALYSASNVVVYPDIGTDLPDQAYKITSKGELMNEGQVDTFKIVTAYRSFPYLPLGFDDAIYSSQDIAL